LVPGGVCEQIQAPVLISITQDVEGKQGVSRWVGSWHSVERLQLLERCLCSERGVLELPGDLAGCVPPLRDVLPSYVLNLDAIDRKLVACLLLFVGASDQGCDEVVQAGASVVDELPDEQRPIRVDGFQRYLEDVLAGISVEFCGDGLTLNVGGPFDRFAKTVEVEHRSPPLAFVIPQKTARRHRALTSSP